MAKQYLGKAKHARCEQVGGKTYTACLVRGNWHEGRKQWAECWIDKHNADWVEFGQGTEVTPWIRDGQRVRDEQATSA